MCGDFIKSKPILLQWVLDFLPGDAPVFRGNGDTVHARGPAVERISKPDAIIFFSGFILRQPLSLKIPASAEARRHL